MAYRIEIKPRAERDLEAIFKFIQAEDSEAANKWFTGLRTSIRSLTSLPERGTTISKAGAYRQLLYGSLPHVYRIIYRIEPSQVITIAHIRHGARQGSGIN